MTSVLELVAEAKRNVENLDPHAVSTEIEAGALLVDLREAEERRTASIPGSVHAPRGMLEFYADPSLPIHNEQFQSDRRIILHCASGGRSALGAMSLQQMGYANVAHLDGGLAAWQAAGLPIDVEQ